MNNGSNLKYSEIGEGENALLINTTNPDCCKRPPRGECYGPDGKPVARNMDGEKLYRNRGNQVVRLHSRLFGLSVLKGEYRCCVPDECDNDICFHFNLGEQSPSNVHNNMPSVGLYP